MNLLFSPQVIRCQILRNRIVVPPMVVSPTDEKGYVTPTDVQHYQELAAGGAGLIIQEATAVSSTGKLADRQLGIWEDGQIEGLKEIPEAVHAEGGKIVVQIHHAGLIAVGDQQDAPSDIDYDYYGRICHGKEMTAERAEEIKNQFIEAGRRAFEAGYDGVELHGAHSYLLSQILNPEVNRRTDELGLNPTQYIQDIIDKIRKKTSECFLIGIRIGAWEPTLEKGLRNIRKLAQAVDFLDISSGFGPAEKAPEEWAFSDLSYGAKAVKEMLVQEGIETPVFSVGGITDPEIAKQILETAKVDMVDIGRGHLVNPQWTQDAQASRNTGKCLHCKVCRYKEGKCPGIVLLNKWRKDHIDLLQTRQS